MRTLQANAPSRAAGADGQTTIGQVVQTSQLVGVSYIPDAAIAGANTNTRKIALVNRGPDGSGMTEVAALQFNSGIDAAENAAEALALSANDEQLEVRRGDVLEFVSTHIGTGIADPGGLVQVEIR